MVLGQPRQPIWRWAGAGSDAGPAASGRGDSGQDASGLDTDTDTGVVDGQDGADSDQF